MSGYHLRRGWLPPAPGVVTTWERLTQLQRWALQTAERIGHNKAAVALANKLVRICWAVWCHERRFSGDWQSARPA